MAQRAEGLQGFPGLQDLPVLSLEFCGNFGWPEFLGGFAQPLPPGFVKGLLPGGVGKEVAPLEIPDDGHAGQVLHERGKQPFTLLQFLFRLFQVAEVGDGRAAYPLRR